MSYAQIMAKRRSYEERLKKLDSTLHNGSGIYVFTREENGIRYAYVGQARHLLNRLVDHLTRYNQHIDLSLKSHGLYSEKKPHGWEVKHYDADEKNLDKAEKYYIAYYANRGFQLRNKTVGGQSEGKTGLDNNAPTKGYYDGVKRGYEKCLSEVRKYFKQYLDFIVKEPSLKPNGEPYEIKKRKFEEFKEFLEGKEIGHS